MVAPINLTGLPADYPVPLTAVEIRFGMGPSGGSGGPYTALIIGNKTSAGTASTNIVYPNETTSMGTEADVISLFGPGSEAHRLYRKFVQVNQSTQVYIIAPPEDVSAVAGTLTLTLATTATAPGVLRTFVEDEFVDVPIATGDTPSAIATAAAQKINNQTTWAVTCTPSSATYVINSKNLGPRANEIRVRAVMLGAPGMTVSGAATSTPLASGATADSWTTALAAIAPFRFYYIISPSSSISGTTFDDLLTQVLAQALPVSGNRQIVVTGHVGTQNAASTIAANTAVNTARARIVWQEESEWTAGELAAQFAGARALFDTSRSPKYNFDGFGATPSTQQFWKVPPQSQSSKRPTSGVTGSIASAVNNGLTCIATLRGGTGTYVVMDVTTKHKNSTNYDYRNRDGHITTVCDFFADQAEIILDDMRSGKNLVSDPPQGSIITDPDTVYPTLIKARIIGLINSHDSANGGDGWFKNVETMKAGTRFQISPTNQSRSEGYVPAQVTNLHHQATLLVDDVSSATA
jgi:hypothetical protein